MKLPLSFLRFHALLLVLTLPLVAATCSSSDPSPTPAPPVTATPQTIEFRYVVTGAEAANNGPLANLRVYNTTAAGLKDSLIFSSEDVKAWAWNIPNGTYSQTLTRRFKKGEVYLVQPWFRTAGYRLLQPTTNLHVEAWSGTTQLGETDLGYADRDNAAYFSVPAPDQDLVKRVPITIP